MSEPMFSVLIPAYNVEGYLTECLDGVLRQTFRDWEAVVIDDGSTDGTGGICDSFARKDPRFRIFHEKNHGIAFTRNCLIRRSRGRSLIFLDGDDYWADPKMLQFVFDEIKDKQADVVAWWALLLDERTKQMRECRNEIPISRVPMDGAAFLGEMARAGNCKWWGWLYAFQRELWEKSNVAFKEGRVICEDEEVLFQVLANARRVCTIGKHFYCYRIGREASLTGKMGQSQIRDMLDVAACNIRLALQMDIPETVKKRLCGNFSGAYLETGPFSYDLEKEDKEQCLKMLCANRWMLRYCKWNGNGTLRIKYRFIRFLGVRRGFGLIYLIQKIKGIRLI